MNLLELGPYTSMPMKLTQQLVEMCRSAFQGLQALAKLWNINLT